MTAAFTYHIITLVLDSILIPVEGFCDEALVSSSNNSLVDFTISSAFGRYVSVGTCRMHL